MAKIISVFSSKGGVGKSLIVTNLGVALSSTFNKKTLVIDCNLTNPHLGLYLGTVSFWPVTLNNVLNNESTLDKAIHTHPSGLDIIPASFTSRDIEKMGLYKLKTRLRDKLNNSDREIILLDSSPGLTKESLFTLRCSDEILFVATPHLPAIIDITKCLQILKQRDAKPIGIVLNRVKNKKYELSDEEIQQFTNLPILAKIPEDDDVLKSTNFKVPVVSLSPNAPASRSFFALAAQLSGEEYTINQTFFEKLRSFFRH